MLKIAIVVMIVVSLILYRYFHDNEKNHITEEKNNCIKKDKASRKKIWKIIKVLSCLPFIFMIFIMSQFLFLYGNKQEFSGLESFTLIFKLFILKYYPMLIVAVILFIISVFNTREKNDSIEIKPKNEDSKDNKYSFKDSDNSIYKWKKIREITMWIVLVFIILIIAKIMKCDDNNGITWLIITFGLIFLAPVSVFSLILFFVSNYKCYKNNKNK